MKLRIAAAAAILAAAPLHAQLLPDPGPLQRPEPRLPPQELPRPELAPAPELRIPALPALPRGPDSALRVQVRAIRIEGSTVLDAAELRELASQYENRELGTEELHELRYRLTQLYISRGYINSGFVLPDQSPEGGTVLYRAVEGRLVDVLVDAEGLRLSAQYVSSRLLRANAGVLNVQQLRNSLALLQQAGLIERVNAELLPGERLGEAVLRVKIREADATQAVLSLGNDRSPSVGALHGELQLSHRNLTGHADVLEARVGKTSGAHEYALAYSVPLGADDTVLQLRHVESSSLVVEAPFNPLNIIARASVTSVGLARPLWRDLQSELSGAVARETKSSQTYLLGAPFAFTAGVPDGHSEVKLWRLAGEYLRRSGDSAAALRVAWHSGDSNTESPKPVPAAPDRRYSYATLQAQWIRRLFSDQGEVLARFEAQYTRSMLLPIERFSLGGLYKLRGLRESQFIRDRGDFESLEYRHRLTEPDSALGALRGAVFVERGAAANVDGSNSDPRSVISRGIGLLAQHGSFSAQLYIAKASWKPSVGHGNLQDHGIHFLLQQRL